MSKVHPAAESGPAEPSLPSASGTVLVRFTQSDSFVELLHRIKATCSKEAGSRILDRAPLGFPRAHANSSGMTRAASTPVRRWSRPW